MHVGTEMTCVVNGFLTCSQSRTAVGVCQQLFEGVVFSLSLPLMRLPGSLPFDGPSLSLHIRGTSLAVPARGTHERALPKRRSGRAHGATIGSGASKRRRCDPRAV